MMRMNEAPLVLRLPIAAGRTIRMNSGDEGAQLFAASCDDSKGELWLNGELLSSFALCGMIWVRSTHGGGTPPLLLRQGDTLTARGAAVRCWVRMPGVLSC